MPYLGNSSLPFDPTRTAGQPRDAERFSGNGSTTNFTLSRIVNNPTDVELFVNNVQQEPIVSYNIIGTTLSFTVAPPLGTNNIYIIYRAFNTGASVSVPDGSITYSKIANNLKLFTTDNLTPNGNNSVFTLSEIPPDANALFVVIDGLVRRAPENYTVSGQTITFATPPAANSNVQVRHLGIRTNQTITAIAANTYIPRPNISSPVISGNGIRFPDNSVLSSAAALGFKNRIINGAMMVDQRWEGAAITPATTAFVGADRWGIELAESGKLTIQNVIDAPDNSPFSNSIKVTLVSTTTLGANSNNQLYTAIEGYNVADFKWGTPYAKPATLSFWIKTSVPGNYSVSFRNITDSRCYVSVFTINSPNTWEKKTVTIPGDTTGTWDKKEGRGIIIGWGLGAGVNLDGPANVWQTTPFTLTTSACIDFLSQSNGSTWNITGVQLELGEIATDFEFRPFLYEFMLCKRYLQKLNHTDDSYSVNAMAFRDSNYFIITLPFHIPMRTGPSLYDPVYSMTGLSTGTTQGLVNIFNLSTGSQVVCTANTGAWDITKSTSQKAVLRFTGTSLSGSTGHIGAVDSLISNSKFFLSAEVP